MRNELLHDPHPRHGSREAEAPEADQTHTPAEATHAQLPLHAGHFRITDVQQWIDLCA